MSYVNVVCMKWGDKFDAEYVNKLYNMVRRHLTLPFRFWCITDDIKDISGYINVQSLPDFIVEKIQGRYKKLIMFDNDIYKFKGTVLYIDLNSLILDNMDDLFTYNPRSFVIIKNWLQAPGNGRYASGLMRFEPGKYKMLWDRFLDERPDLHNNFHHGRRWNVHDQGWISCLMPDSTNTWPEDWASSFKYSCHFKANHKREKPKKSKILLFHGKPNLHEAKEEWVKELWK